MNKIKKINFEISERKVLLRFFDVIFVWLALNFIGNLLELNYIEVLTSSFYYFLAFSLYINGIGTIFEMYNLQVASCQHQILKSVSLTVLTPAFLYLLTPIYSVTLPSQRLQIVLFFFTTLLALSLWRISYVRFFASNRFVQNVILVCLNEQLEELIVDLEKADPHYKIVAYVNSDGSETISNSNNCVRQIGISDMVTFVSENNIF